MSYTASITCASLRLRESRVVADLLLQNVSADDWRAAIIEQNVLQIRSASSARRISGLLRARLEPLGEGLWLMVRDGAPYLATQAVFAGAVKNSRLLGDFLRYALAQQRATFAPRLDNRVWTDYLAGCRGRDADMPQWGDSTTRRLRSSVFSMLAQAGYISDTRDRALLSVFIDEQLRAYLKERDENYVLQCLEVAE